MKVNIGADLRIPIGECDPALLTAVCRDLTIENFGKERAIREKVWGAESQPDTIALYSVDQDDLVCPRGFVFRLSQIADAIDAKIEWDRSMHREDGFLDDVGPISLRDYQAEAVEVLSSFCGGIYKADTGAGKSRVMLETARRCGQKTVVIVEKKDLATQWIRVAQELGFNSVGLVGDDCWEDKEFVVAMRQTLWSAMSSETLRIDEWARQFGTVIVDEAHHASSRTMQILMSKFPAFYRYGCTATPYSDQEKIKVLEVVVGPVVHETKETDAAQYLVTPKIIVLDSEFDFEYVPTEIVNGRRIQNNYHKLLKAITNDGKRNRLIVFNAIQEAEKGHTCVILTHRIEHIVEIRKIATESFDSERVLVLTGDNSSEANDVRAKIEESERGTILISTVMDEGTDFPRCDRLFLSFPGRKIRRFEQAIGRIMRPHPSKTDAIVYDVRDRHVSLLRAQFRERAQLIYAKRGYEVSVAPF